MFISTTTLTSSPSDLTAVGQKQEACSSIGLLARQSPSDRPLTTPSSTTLSMAIRQPNWSEADTLSSLFSRRQKNTSQECRAIIAKTITGCHAISFHVLMCAVSCCVDKRQYPHN